MLLVRSDDGQGAVIACLTSSTVPLAAVVVAWACFSLAVTAEVEVVGHITTMAVEPLSIVSPRSLTFARPRDRVKRGR